MGQMKISVITVTLLRPPYSKSRLQLEIVNFLTISKINKLSLNLLPKFKFMNPSYFDFTDIFSSCFINDSIQLFMLKAENVTIVKSLEFISHAKIRILELYQFSTIRSTSNLYI